MDRVNLTCIGGGHGLGHLLSAVSSLAHCQVTGIVCTTDNGGSTGRLREHSDGIAWGDIRYCLSKLSKPNEIKSLLFEYRFDNAGELSGHSLGNLMCTAVDSLCLRPTDSVKVMRDFLGIKTKILPMSDHATDLVGVLNSGEEVIGELAVDEKAVLGIEQLLLRPAVRTSEEVITAIANTDILLLGPGSFYTSVIPSLLVAGVVEAINANSTLQLYFLANVKPEFTSINNELDKQIKLFAQLGIKHQITCLLPTQRADEAALLEPCINESYSSEPDASEPYTSGHRASVRLLPIEIGADKHGRHRIDELQQLIIRLTTAS
ncbi:uridine diphosphate-N-acetylglucosamine-binding protein YvcK [Thalassotalea euphylliae]|uniref:Uridine diphosphate-N-acetylglucosamine-binding protein YvcK n=1 Tax=Thalassotalea euphylliae TaxID=1655234 RepID=A0A3E0TU72_9GAMM|nr:uridine diphosphate-N-acetylglucosamine-binding protein YvcK [Thalassotalea euphylliae]REL28019.1 uridine diphosphate-N-acetylglucosamine-binding protein YvcK [Thalassotalea euphylliae]